MTTEPKPRKGGPVPTHAERQAAGEVRIDVYLPLDAAQALYRLCEREAEETGQAVTKCRTRAIVRAIVEADRRLKK